MYHNANLNEEQIENKAQFLKATASWVLKNEFTKSTNFWKNKIMEKVEKYCTDKILMKLI